MRIRMAAAGARWRGLIVLALAVAVAVAVLIPSVRAGTQPPLTVDPGATVSRSYPPLVGTFPAGPNVPAPDPANCANLPSCDVIPLTVTQPKDLSIFDRFVVEIELSWTNDTPVADDLNLYLWYDPQTADAASASATDQNPEVVRFAEPTSGKFQIVVANASGANTGYTVTVHSLYERGDRPADLGDDAIVPPPSSSGSPSAGSSAHVSPGGVSSPPLVVPPGEAPPPIAPASAVPDSAGASTAAPSDSGLAGLGSDASVGGAGQLFRQSQSEGRPRPVSPPLLILWTVIVPLLVAGGAMGGFLRFRPRALTLGIDAPGNSTA